MVRDTPNVCSKHPIYDNLYKTLLWQGSPSWPAPVCPSLQALESVVILENKRQCCSGVAVSGITGCCHAAGSASSHRAKERGESVPAPA